MCNQYQTKVGGHGKSNWKSQIFYFCKIRPAGIIKEADALSFHDSPDNEPISGSPLKLRLHSDQSSLHSLNSDNCSPLQKCLL